MYLHYLNKMYLKIFRLLLLVFTSAFLTGCNEDPTVKAAIAYVDSALATHPDSALAVIRSINPAQIRGARLKAEYSLAHSVALDKNYIDLKTDSIIRPAIKYYDRKGTYEKKAQAFYYLGRIYCNNKDPENAIQTLSEAESCALKARNPNLSGLIYNTLGNLYYSQESFIDAIAMFRKSSEYFGKAGELRKKANALSFLGKTMRLVKEFDSSTVYYQQAKNIYVHLNDGPKVLLMNSGLAEKLFSTKQYHEAITLLNSGYEQYNKNEIPIRDYPLWANIYMEQGNLEKSREFALTALEHKYTTGRIKSGLYVLLYQSYLKSQNYKDAYSYLTLYTKQAIADSQKDKENLIQEIQERYAKEKLRLSYHALQQKHLYQTIITVLLFLMAFTTGYVLFSRQRNNRRRMQERYERELEEAHNYLESAKENYAQLNSQYLAIKEASSENDEKTLRFLHAFENRLSQMKNITNLAYTSESTPVHFYNKFKEYMSLGSKEENAFADLQYVVNEKYFGIIDHLKKHYPNLAKSDLDFCSMICFGFTANSIRLIYGHTNLESIFQRRSRLRERLNIPNNVQLDTFIRNLQEELQKKKASKRSSGY